MVNMGPSTYLNMLKTYSDDLFLSQGKGKGPCYTFLPRSLPISSVKADCHLWLMVAYVLKACLWGSWERICYRYHRLLVWVLRLSVEVSGKVIDMSRLEWVFSVCQAHLWICPMCGTQQLEEMGAFCGCFFFFFLINSSSEKLSHERMATQPGEGRPWLCTLMGRYQRSYSWA